MAPAVSVLVLKEAVQPKVLMLSTTHIKLSAYRSRRKKEKLESVV